MYWLARQRNYLARTAAWVDFPQGRWGRRKQEIGKLPHYLATRPATVKGLQARAATLAATPVGSAKDAAACFKAFFSGKAAAFPWAEGTKPSPEATVVAEKVWAHGTAPRHPVLCRLRALRCPLLSSESAVISCPLLVPSKPPPADPRPD